MARPKRGNFATGEAGLARYKEALRKYLAKTKKTEVKKTEVKKPVAKKPVAKKPATKTPTAKKPVAKKPPVKKPVAKKPPVKKPVAKKPAAKKPVAKKPPVKKPVAKKTASSLKIKKAANTTRQALKKAAPKVKKAVKTAYDAGKKGVSRLQTKFAAKDQTPQQANPAPKTKGQKLMSRLNKSYQSYKGEVKTKAGETFKSSKSKLTDKSLKGQRSTGGRAALAMAGGKFLTDAVFNRIGRPKGMSVKEYDAAKKKMRSERNLLKDSLKIVKRIRGKSGESSTSKNIKKQKKANTTPSSGLKIKKTQYSSNAAKKKQNFGAATGTKKADKRFGTFREGDKENRKLQLERQGGKKETYSRKVSKEAEKTKAKTVKSSGKKMHAIEKRNRKIFGDAHVERLKRQHEAFKRRRKKK